MLMLILQLMNQSIQISIFLFPELSPTQTSSMKLSGALKLKMIKYRMKKTPNLKKARPNRVNLPITKLWKRFLSLRTTASLQPLVMILGKRFAMRHGSWKDLKSQIRNNPILIIIFYRFLSQEKMTYTLEIYFCHFLSSLIRFFSR